MLSQPRPPTPTLFPYTTLFRSRPGCSTRAREARPPPASEVRLRRRTVRAQIAAGHLEESLIGIELAPRREPLRRTDERHARPAARAKAQLTTPGRRFQQSAPSRPEPLAQPSGPAFAHRGDELLPAHGRRGQCRPDAVGELDR